MELATDASYAYREGHPKADDAHVRDACPSCPTIPSRCLSCHAGRSPRETD